MKETSDLITQYKKLWREIFGDSPEFIDDIFAIGHPVMLADQGQLISALLLIPYSIDMGSKSTKAFYVYGVLTANEYRRQGYAARLLEQAHQEARAQGGEYSFLIAANDHLRQYYIGLGYSDIIPASPTGLPEIMHSDADMRLVKKYQDPMRQEKVQLFSLNNLQIPNRIKAQGLLSS